jgi:phosphatidylserine/phosphatidylglycerophosphate/cardiolipin synthase-like enzyme
VTRLPLPRARDHFVRQVPLRWVEDSDHYDLVVDALARAQVSLWIATANLKDVRLEAPIGSAARARRRYVSIAERFEELLARGVELRVLHGGPPSRAFREALARRKQLAPTRAWLRQCPRVHLKILAVDGAELYLGSANLTGAGMGAKSAGRRNFEHSAASIASGRAASAPAAACARPAQSRSMAADRRGSARAVGARA